MPVFWAGTSPAHAAQCCRVLRVKELEANYPQLNTAYRDLSGRLLSALEVHDLVRSGQHSRIMLTSETQMRAEWTNVAAKDNTAIEDLEVPQGFSAEELWDSLPDHGDFDGFKRFWLDNHYHLTFNTSYGLVRTKTLSGTEDAGTLFLYDAGNMPPAVFQGMRQTVVFVQDRSAVDFAVNGVEVQWRLPEVPEDAPLEATRQLTLRLTHSMPWFDHFEVAIDGKGRNVSGDRLDLTLHEGDNEISVTPVNDLGRSGSTAKITFRVL